MSEQESSFSDVLRTVQGYIAAEAVGRLIGRVQVAQHEALIDGGMSADDAMHVVINTSRDVAEVAKVVMPVIIETAPTVLQVLDGLESVKGKK